MFDLINGIPLHPLVVHAIVVLLPLATIGTLAIALRPRWRTRYGPLVVGAALVATFLTWHRREGTLSIHTIDTSRREAFYWLAVLFTFALGTSAGDLVGEKLALGYLTSGLIFGALIALVTVGFWRGGLNAVLAFWAAYVLTRPFGASLGDYLTAKPADGGLGLGTNGTSALFLTVIVAAVAWFTIQQRRTDDTAAASLEAAAA